MSKNSGKSSVKKEAKEKRTAGSSAKAGKKSIKRRYLNSRATCKVTFRLPKEAAPDAETVTIVGDFNNWNLTENRMRRLKNGDFTLTLELPCNREYSFRYLIDSNRWEKDWFADKHIPGDSDVDDSVLLI